MARPSATTRDGREVTTFDSIGAARRRAGLPLGVLEVVQDAERDDNGFNRTLPMARRGAHDQCPNPSVTARDVARSLLLLI